MLSTREIADHIGTTPKLLRQFLRQSDFGVGSGARYAFTADDLPGLAEGFAQWAGKRALVNRGEDSDGAPGLSTAKLASRKRADKAEFERIANERVDRLEAMLKAQGVHISQLGNQEIARRSARTNT